MLTDPWFYAVALPAVAMTGLSKGGLQGASLLSLPLLALVMPPFQAAAIMLPVLMMQDVFAVTAFRRTIDWTMLKLMLPGVLVGTIVGWLTASIVTSDHIKLLVGVLTLLFCLNAMRTRGAVGEAKPHNSVQAAVFGGLSAFTSFLVHAGGPPFSIYALPRRLEKETLAGTTSVFFMMVNWLKVPAYSQLGQLTKESLALSAALFPAAVAANLLGIWIVRRMPTAPFYRVLYVLLFLVSIKLIWDGGRGVLAA
ncbi:MAG: sulfite exporter TauE/SafE family protein [Hyphomicrobiaceae bacterium]|nr:sulfite exporter TauE/SafE family protein [Hyphomicrobiaceae bacterium]